MNAKDYTDFHSLAEQFRGEMSLKDMCSQEGVNYRSYITWRKRMGYSKSRKTTAPATMVQVEVTDLPSAQLSAGSAKVHIEFENGLVLDREAHKTIHEKLPQRRKRGGSEETRLHALPCRELPPVFGQHRRLLHRPVPTCEVNPIAG